MQWANGTAYLARAVSYNLNMIMKYTTGENLISILCVQGTAVAK